MVSTGKIYIKDSAKRMNRRKETMENYEVQVQQQAGKISCDFEAGKAYLKEIAICMSTGWRLLQRPKRSWRCI